MTDLKKTEKFLDGFKIPYRKEESDLLISLIIEVGHNNKVIGHGNFHVDFYFAKDGSYAHMGVWE